MMPEVEKILTLVGSFGLGAVIGGGIISYILKSFLPSYLSEKGGNLATKEDIGNKKYFVVLKHQLKHDLVKIC